MLNSSRRLKKLEKHRMKRKKKMLHLKKSRRRIFSYFTMHTSLETTGQQSTRGLRDREKARRRRNDKHKA